MSVRRGDSPEQLALETAIKLVESEILVTEASETQKLADLTLASLLLNGILSAQSADPQLAETIQTQIVQTPSHKFGHLLANKRELAGLSVSALGDAAGLSIGTIDGFEKGVTQPTHVALTAISQVKSLEINIKDLPWDTAETDPTTGLNCLITKEADPIRLAAEFRRYLTAPGSLRDFRHLFSDVESAAVWITATSTTEFLATQESIPMEDIARTVVRNVPCVNLDVVMLGASRSPRISVLFQELAENPDLAEIRITYCELSFPLFSHTFHRFNNFFQARKIPFRGILGDYQKIGDFHRQLVDSKNNNRCRLITLSGCLFCELRDGMNFVRNQLSFLREGDLLLIDVRFASGDRESPGQKILDTDGDYFRGERDSIRSLAFLWDECLMVPFRSCVRDGGSVSIERSVSRTSHSPGLYSIKETVHVKLGSGESYSFLVRSSARFDSASFQTAFSEEGWEMVQLWEYGRLLNGHKPLCGYFLFRKQKSR